MSSEQENAQRRKRRSRSDYAGARACGFELEVKPGRRVNAWGDSVTAPPIVLSRVRTVFRVPPMTHNARGEAVQRVYGPSGDLPTGSPSRPLAVPLNVARFPQETTPLSEGPTHAR